MNYQKLIVKAEKEVTAITRENNSPAFVFHNIDHTRYLVKCAEKIAGYHILNEEEHFILMVSSWFYDIELAESKSDSLSPAGYATKFLNRHEISPDITNQVASLITAGASNEAPSNTLEEIMNDAVTYYFGKKICLAYFEDQRKEKELFTQKEIDRETWLKWVLDTLQNHTYYTIFCRQSLAEGKLKNIMAITKELNPDSGEDTLHGKQIKLTETGKNKPEKAIDAMFRISESNGQRLSVMADNKAHILITVNSIILSAVISILLRKLDDNRDLIVPTILLLAVCLTSMSFSILSTRPSLPWLTSRPAKRHKENVNLLFFGNFYHMSLEAYSTEMHKMMESEEMIYDCLIKDVHTEGLVLAKKYRLLRNSYNIFMFGIIAATVAFIIASVIQTPKLTSKSTDNTNKISLHHF